MGEHRRYPGSSSFQDNVLDRLLFWGRDQEKSSLLHLILAETLVLLYSKSGCGKTSLLNAGVFQQLRDKKYQPIVLRLNDPEQTLIRSIQEQVLRQRDPEIEVELASTDPSHLSRFFSALRIWRGNVLLTPVLVFDQFEELFTLNTDERRQSFLREFSDLVRRRLPDEPDKNESWSSSPPPKIVLSIREDYLGEVEQVATYVPRVMAHRFRLTPLTRDKAQEAIHKPAELRDPRISGPGFSYAPDAIDAILDFLCTQRQRGKLVPGGQVEPFQLQILCRHIEDDINKNPAPDGRVVQASDLGGVAGMQRILQGFYKRTIEELAPEMREPIRRLCEQGLISPTEKRLSLEEEEIERQYGVPKELLVKLVEQRLLRADPRVDSRYYELTHDTLVAPILAARQESDPDSINSIIRIAEAYRLKSDFDEALACYERAVSANAQHPLAYASWASLLHQLGRWDDAEKVLARAQQAGLEHEGIYHQSGKVAAAKGNFKGAIEYFKKALQINGTVAAIHADLGAAYRSTGEAEAAAKAYTSSRDMDSTNVSNWRELAAKAFEQSVELDPNSASNWRELALLWIAQGRNEQAINTYRNAVRVNPQFAYMYDSLATELVQRQLKHVALDLCKVALRVDSTDGDYFLKLGRSLMDLGAYEEASEAFGKVTALRDDAWGYLYWGLCLLLLGQKDEGLRLVLKASAMDPIQVLPFVATMFADLNIGDSEVIINLFRQAESAGPLSAENYAAYGRVLVRFNKQQEALEKYDLAALQNPRLIGAHVGRGVVLMTMNRPEEGAAAFQEAIALDPKSAVPYAAWATMLNAVTPPRHEEALEKASRGGELDPTNAPSLVACGDALHGLGRDEEAVEKYDKAAELDPSATVLHKHADALLAVNRYEDAIVKYKIVVEKEPSDAKAHAGWGQALLMLQRESEAIEVLEKAIALAPDNATSHFAAGVSFENLGAFDKAAAHYRRVIELRPESPIGYRKAGFVLGELQQHAEAAQMFEKAIELQDTDFEDFLSLGEQLYKLEKYGEALEKYQKAAELQPTALTYVGCARALRKLGRSEEASARFAKAEAIVTEPELGTLGWYFYGEGDYQRAVDFSRKCLEHTPDLFNARANLALALLHLGRIEEARNEYGQALVLAGNKGGRTSIERFILGDLRQALQRNPKLEGGYEMLARLQELMDSRFPATNPDGLSDQARA